VRQFTGRDGELAALTGLLDTGGAGSPTAVISAIGGMAGVGKTALAVHWAHEAAGRFPDGQLYIDLRGYDPAAPPLAAADALAGFLRALGVPGRDVPGSADERVATYRSLLAGRRFLVLLDNARDAEQVRPLLPGSPGCMTLVTSRDSLGGLVAADGAVRLEVDLLPLPEAVDLLAGLIGARAADDPDATVRLAAQCGRLPLALRVAAQLAVMRSGVALASLTAELADLQNRLDVLETGGDERTAVRAVFTWSYQDLDPVAARMFRLLGVHHGPDISVPAAASLAGVSRAQARRALQELTRAHLVREDAPGRFSCHDLLRAFAAELAAAHDSPAQRRAATLRVLDHYLYTACAADRLVRPSRKPIELPAAEPGTLPEDMADADAALAWFDAERGVLLAAIAHAAGSGLTRHAWQLPWSVASYLETRAHWAELIDTQRTAVAAATLLGDERAQARLHERLGFAYLLRGRHDDAGDHLRQSLELFRRLGDPVGEASVELDVSLLHEWQGRYAEAAQADERALILFRRTGNRGGQAKALNAAGWHLALTGEHQQALSQVEQALAIQQELNDPSDEANIWDSLGYIHDRLGQHEQAASCYQQALRLLGPSKGAHRRAIILDHLGDACRNAGDQQAASEAWARALDIFEDMGHPDAEAVRAKLLAGLAGDDPDPVEVEDHQGS
jgi:tetratricopeptide (TPR) repeat protein